METAGRPLTRSILYGLSGGALSVLFILAAAQQSEAAPAAGGKGGSGAPVDLHKVRELAKGSDQRRATEQAQRKAEEPKAEKPRENPAPRRSVPVGGKGGTGQPVDLRKIRELGKNSDKRREAEQAQRKAEEPKTEKPRENPAPRRSVPVGGKGGTGQPVDLRKIRELGKNSDKRREAEQAQRKTEEPKTEKPRENPAPRRSIPVGGKGGTGQPVDLRKIRELGKNSDKRREAEQAQRKTEEPKTEKPRENPAPRRSIPVGGKGGSGQPVDLRKLMKTGKDKDPKDHVAGNVLDEARETIVEGLESIPPAIKGFVDANHDATTWSEANPDSQEWRAANERIKKRGEAVAAVVRDPGKVVEEVVRPYKEDWNSDKPERVVGRAAVDIGTMFIPGVGVSKRALNATEALSGGRGPDVGTTARPRPDSEPGKGSATASPAPGGLPARPDSVPATPNHQNPPDRADSAPSASTRGSKTDTSAPGTTSRSPNDGDRRGSRVLPNPVTQLPTLPRANRGDSPAHRPADTSRRDTDTPSSRTSDGGESRQRPSDRTPGAGKDTPSVRDKADAADRCITNSFVPGTLVLMADGSRERIENIKPGELVAARNPETGASGARPVAALITGSGQKELVEITVDIDGMAGDRTGVLVATDEHPFWIESERRWVDAEDLAPGQRVQTPDGRALAITATRLSTAQRTVHNLSVTDINTYYVIAGDAPVLVHNANRPCGVTSMIDQDPLLVKAAESAGKNQRIQKEMDDLVQQFREGNTNPGLGNKALEGTDIQYLRGRNGGRVFFRNTDEGMQIVGKADKANESRVIKRLKELYGG